MLSALRMLSRIGSAKDVPNHPAAANSATPSGTETFSEAGTPSEVETSSAMDYTRLATGESNDKIPEPDDWLITPVQQFSDLLEEVSFMSGADLREQMEEEKQMYPGASTWAKPEEELFEALFLRQERPLLPSHWNLDFRGMPMSANIFDTSDEHPPVVYTHSQNDFHGTDSLTRLIDLTADVRTTVQSGLRPKSPTIIKKGLESFITWAARDGGYSHLKYVPNVMVYIVPRKMNHEGIDTFMRRRMRSLSLLQREYLRADRAPDFWEKIASPFLGSRKALETSFGEKLMPYSVSPQKRSSSREAGPSLAGLAMDEFESTPDDQSPDDSVERQRVLESGSTRKHLKRTGDERPSSRSSRLDRGDLKQGTRPRTPVKVKYRRQPPVVYGLFIVGTSVFLLTLDSSKGDDGYVSFHLELDFLDSHQSVWNGLTLAIAICLARDGMIARKEDFEELPAQLESDPDA